MAYVNVRVSKCLKEELVLAIDKRPWVISNMLFKTVIPPRKERIKPF